MGAVSETVKTPSVELKSVNFGFKTTDGCGKSLVKYVVCFEILGTIREFFFFFSTIAHELYVQTKSVRHSD